MAKLEAQGSCMKIHTKIIIDIDSGNIVEDESYDYFGNVSLCKKGASSPPPAPDYVGAAQAQGAANVDAARASAKLSNPNVYSPYGSQTVTYEGDVPTVTQTYSPEVKGLMDQNIRTQQGLSDTAQLGMGNVQNVLGSKFDTSNVPDRPINPGTTAQEAIMQRLQPQLERQRSQLDTQLANQGIMRGSEAYQNAMKDQSQRENDLYSQSALQGINLDNQAHQQGLQEAAYLRELPLNEVTSLLGASQVNTPNFQGYQGAQAQAAPLFGATQAMGDYKADLYNAQAANKSGMLGGLMSLGGQLGSSWIQQSDRRLKRDIKKIGELPNGLNVYSFKYLNSDEKQIGFMADEVEKVKPDAVMTGNDGFKSVDYLKVLKWAG